MENATVLDVPLYVDIKQNKNLANFNNEFVNILDMLF